MDQLVQSSASPDMGKSTATPAEQIDIEGDANTKQQIDASLSQFGAEMNNDARAEGCAAEKNEHQHAPSVGEAEVGQSADKKTVASSCKSKQKVSRKQQETRQADATGVATRRSRRQRGEQPAVEELRTPPDARKRRTRPRTRRAAAAELPESEGKTDNMYESQEVSWAKMPEDPADTTAEDHDVAEEKHEAHEGLAQNNHAPWDELGVTDAEQGQRADEEGDDINKTIQADAAEEHRDSHCFDAGAKEVEQQGNQCSPHVTEEKLEEEPVQIESQQEPTFAPMACVDGIELNSEASQKGETKEDAKAMESNTENTPIGDLDNENPHMQPEHECPGALDENEWRAETSKAGEVLSATSVDFSHQASLAPSHPYEVGKATAYPADATDQQSTDGELMPTAQQGDEQQEKQRNNQELKLSMQKTNEDKNAGHDTVVAGIVIDHPAGIERKENPNVMATELPDEPQKASMLKHSTFRTQHSENNEQRQTGTLASADDSARQGETHAIPPETSEPRTATRSNILTTVSSFVPQVREQQREHNTGQRTDAVASGKHSVQVKSIERAHAARRAELEKQEERKKRKELLAQKQYQHGTAAAMKRAHGPEQHSNGAGDSAMHSHALAGHPQRHQHLRQQHQHMPLQRSAIRDEAKRQQSEMVASYEAEQGRRLLHSASAAKHVQMSERTKHTALQPRPENRKDLHQNPSETTNEKERIKQRITNDKSKRKAVDSPKPNDVAEDGERKKQRQALAQQEQNANAGLSVPTSSANHQNRLQSNQSPLQRVVHQQEQAGKENRAPRAAQRSEGPRAPRSRYSALKRTSNGHQLQKDGYSPTGEDFKSIEISPVKRKDSDSDDEKPRREVPAWAKNPLLHRQLAWQSRQDPDEIFAGASSSTCDLVAMFESTYSRKRDFCRRTDSGDWSQDALTPSEDAVYKRKMGFVTSNTR